MAGQVDALYIYLLLVSGVMTALIFLAVAVLAIKYRRVPGREAHQIEGSTILELGWSIIPFFVMLTFFIWGAVIYFQERTPPADATEVYVVAKQWMWKIEHMEGQREINELHVPTGQNVKLIMTSQDVIHSFFIPAFRIKQDVLARPLHHALVQGHQCPAAIICSAPNIAEPITPAWAATSSSWSRRITRNGWRAGRPRRLQETGKQLFAQLGCATCHRSDMQGRGPNLAGIYNKPVLLEDGRTVTADENYVRESILNPTAKIVNGFQAGDADLPGHRQRRAIERAGGLRKIVKSSHQPREPPDCRTSPPLPRHNHRIRRCNSHGEHSNPGESGSSGSES